MTVPVASYKARRRMGKHDLARLVLDFKAIRAAREKAKAAAASSPPPPPPAAPLPAAAAPLPGAAAPAPAAAPPQDELLSMMADKRKREQEVEEMKARMADDMAQTMDVGVRPNASLAAYYAKKAKTEPASPIGSEPTDSEPDSSDLELSD